MKVHPDIVGIGASSGEIEALQSLLEGLSDLDAIVLVVSHRPAIVSAICVISLCETSTCRGGTEARGAATSRRLLHRQAFAPSDGRGRFSC